MRYFFLTLLLSFSVIASAQTISGTVTDAATDKPLPFASVYIKGTTQGTTTNDKGKFELKIEKLPATIICQYIGYEKQEKEISAAGSIVFSLSQKHTQIRTVKISVSGEDPAYRIIREAIKKRPDYNKEVEQFAANCYVKGKIKLNETPNLDGFIKLLGGGNESDEASESLDSMKGILYLSESYTKIGYQRKPAKYKIKVLSSKVSGSQDDYGFSEPMFINFYENNMNISSDLNPRGLVSPIADGALRYYNYKLLESYYEDGEWVNRIQVTPKRKLEPVFVGEIHIIDNSWRIHSVDVMATKEYDLNVLDTVRIKQIHVPTNTGYTVKDQTFSFMGKIFGFGFLGQFVNVFTNYTENVSPTFFDKYVMEYDSLALKKNNAHWDSIRVIPLEAEEIKDYAKKDSLAEVQNTRMDSMSARPFSYKPLHIIQRGLGYKFSNGTSIKTDALIGLNRFKYNTVEGIVYEIPVRFYHRINKDKGIYASAYGRYGFGSKLASAKGFTRYTWGKSNKKALRLGGGQYVFQYNNNEPVSEFLNSISTLFYGQNYLKTYQAIFGKASFSNYNFSGFSYKIGMDYQKRNPLYNTQDFTFGNKENNFTANYPTEILSNTIPHHSRIEFAAQISYQPGRQLIKYPDRIVSTSSRYPTFFAGLKVAAPIFNTTSDYAKWMAGSRGGLDLKLLGQFQYKLTVGGFLRKETVFAPDFTHFNGNQLILASEYLNSFQLAPYYANSNTESFYTTYHAEHHFNGLGTNKIPLFRKLKYYLVAASNGYYVNPDNNYIEISAGLENVGFKLFRFFRVDAVVGYQNFSDPVFGIRIGVSSNMVSMGDRGDEEE